MASDREKSLLNRMFDGRYLIVRKLGSGGMAEVYLAEDQELGRKVALKMLDERHARDDQFVERFKREARNAAGLSHPNIVQIYDRGQAEGTYYIAMEYLEGPTLKDLLVRKGPTPPQTAIKFAREILSALAEAHRHQIVHRDIKPHNVIVGLPPDWQIKVTDFGIARSGASQMTEVGAIVGTAQYLSPEQARGAPVDQRSDLYSLGIVLYEMLTGTVPFSGEAAVEIAMKHLTAVPLPPSALRPEIPHSLDAVVMRALAKEPGERYASAEEMDADLVRVAAGHPPSLATEAALTQILASPTISFAPTVVRNAPGGPPDLTPPNGYGLEPLPLPPARRRRLWPPVLWFVAIVILAAGGYLVYREISTTIQGPGTVVVDDVLETPLAGAKTLLSEEGLVPKVVYQPSMTEQAGFVFKQSPSSTQVVKKRSVVTLTVSSGKPTHPVPSLTGATLANAESALNALGFVVKVDRHFSSSPPGTVTAQAPPAQTSLTVGDTVRINVSNGPPTSLVPSVIGESYQAAESTLKSSGFVAAEQQANNPAPVNQVFAQNPAANVKAPKGEKIVLSVSQGPLKVAVPQVIGETESQAYQNLQAAHFSVNPVSEPVTDPGQNGIVTQQSPAANTQQPSGSSVTIDIGNLVTPTSPAATTTGAATTDTVTTSTTTATGTTSTQTTPPATPPPPP
jgi:eukaryotic-like serine/threonine-protein kinase